MSTTFEKTWYHAWNYAPSTTSAATQEKNVPWFLKAFLMGQLPTYYNGAGASVSPSGLWTCYSSNDGAGGFGNGDTTDRWTSTYDSTKIVQAAGGSNHSNFTLKSPVAYGPVYLTIDMNSVTGTVWSLTQSFTAPSGGTATAAPTAADSVSLSAITFCSANTTQHFHASLSSDGDFSFFITDTGGVMSAAMIFQKPADKKSADSYPWVMYYKAGSTCLSSANLGTAANWAAKNFNASANLTGLGVVDLHVASTASIMSTMALQDYTDNLYDDPPLYLFNNVAAAYTRKGRLYDLRAAPQTLPNGFAEPSASAPLSVVMGSSIWAPTYTIPLM